MMQIQKLEQAHLPAVAALEKEIFSEPWSEEALSLFLSDEAAGYCAIEDGVVVAYGSILWAPDEGQILNLAVRPAFRRRGYAKAILLALEGAARARGAGALFLEVRASNLPAELLYRSVGFLPVGRRTHFYKNPAEDAIVMKKDLCD